MDKSAFENLESRKLSIATNKSKIDGTPESYIGYLVRVGDNFIELDYGKASNVPHNTIDKVFISLEVIIGVWVYLNNTS